MLREISQTKKDKNCSLSLTWNIKSKETNKINEQIKWNHEKHLDIENKVVVPHGERWGPGNWVN